MNIVILGTGNMASGLAKQISKAGHRLHIVGRHPDKATALAARVGATALAAGEAAAKAEVIIVATGYPEALPALGALGDLTGKVVVDITNPLTADFMGLTLGHSTSAAEEIAKALPGAQVVKAFNTVFAQVLEEGPDFGNGQVVPVFYAGDSERARETVRVLIESSDGETTWTTVGVSTDIIAASWQALTYSIEYILHQKEAETQCQ